MQRGGERYDGRFSGTFRRFLEESVNADQWALFRFRSGIPLKCVATASMHHRTAALENTDRYIVRCHSVDPCVRAANKLNSTATLTKLDINDIEDMQYRHCFELTQVRERVSLFSRIGDDFYLLSAFRGPRMSRFTPAEMNYFAALAELLLVTALAGQFLRRMPDGETGERMLWIKFQQKMLFEHPAMEHDPTHPPLPVKQADGTVHRHIQLLRLKLDADPDTLEFQTGYDLAAAASYRIFRELRDAHIVPAYMRLQIALPTPMATGLMYVSPVGRDRYLRAYEHSLLKALRNILSVIPHEDLSIQFDVCQEVLLFENYFPVREPNFKQQVFEQFARLGAAVPNDVELGFHLCYGSPGDRPLLTLNDAGVLAELMNGIPDFVPRPVEFIHIPVPKHATEAFFAPLRNWHRPEGNHLYLGLLQYNDEAGNRERIAAARRVIDDFGVAAECGFGRTDPSRVPGILAGHRAAAQFLAEVT